jgi:DNA-damage-inducible protein D
VRSAIEEIGGTMPENIPPAEHIKTVEKRVKKTQPKLVLDDKDKGLLHQETP